VKGEEEARKMFERGDRVTVLSNGRRYKGQVVKVPSKSATDYQVILPSGAIWLVNPMWLKSRTARPGNF
jgi:hypothetical protein